MKSGFTIIELIIVTVVVVILASAAISGAQPLMRALRLNNSANQITLFLQRARTLAAHNKAAGTEIYGVFFENRKLTLFRSSKKVGQAAQLFEADGIMEEYVPEGQELSIAVGNGLGQPCNIVAAVVYETQRGPVRLICNTLNQTVSILTLKAVSQVAGTTKERIFNIHEGTGVPQGG